MKYTVTTSVAPSEVYRSKEEVFSFLKQHNLQLSNFTTLQNRSPNDQFLSAAGYLSLVSVDNAISDIRDKPRLFVTLTPATAKQVTEFKEPWKLTTEERTLQPDLGPLPGEQYTKETPDSLIRFLTNNSLSLVKFAKPQAGESFIGCTGFGCFCSETYRQKGCALDQHRFIVTKHNATPYNPDPNNIWE